MLTAETFAAVASCLATKLEPAALGTALAALAPMIATAVDTPAPRTPQRSADTTAVVKPKKRRFSRSKRKRANAPAGANATPSTFARACTAYATDPRMSIKSLMAAAKCSSGTAILARRRVREEGVAKFVDLESSRKPDKEAETNGQVARKPDRAEVEANLGIASKPILSNSGCDKMSAPDLPPTALTRATEFLQNHLKLGARAENHIRAAAQIAKISPAVLERAAEDMDVRRRYPGNGAEPVWSLP